MTRRQPRLGARVALGSLAAIALLTLLPHPEAAVRAEATPITCIVCGDAGGVDFFLNLLLFIPFGAGLAMVGFSNRRAIFLCLLVTLLVELLQMKVVTGRDASLGDVVANTLGGGVGVFLVANWRHLALPDSRWAQNISIGYAFALVCVWVGTAWALAPALPQGVPWFGAWAAELENFDRFPGRPLAVSAGGEPLLPGPALDQRRLADAVTRDPSASFRAILGGTPEGLAPVASIYDVNRAEVILLGQERRDLSFRLRMRASILRLRNPAVNLHNGMSGLPGDTVEARGSVHDGVYDLHSRVHGRERSRTLPLSASWGWTLVTPWTSILGEETRAITALWIATLVAPLAYWAAFGGGTALVIASSAILLILVVIPQIAGFPFAHWSEWGGAVLGALLGYLASRVAFRARGSAEGAGKRQDCKPSPSAAT